MNAPDLATERIRTVQQTKLDGVPKDQAWSYIQHVQQMRFEGHALEMTIERIYQDEE